MFPSRWSRIGEIFLSHIKVDSLREAFNALDGTKALGVDSISKAEYVKFLEKNLEQRIQRESYKPMPKREVLIPKGNGWEGIFMLYNEPNQILKSSVREIHMRGSVRVLPFNRQKVRG